MRVEKEFTKTGYFWLPTASDRRVTGTLSVADGGTIQLEIVGSLRSDSNAVLDALNGPAEVGRVLGLIEGEGFVTLEDCFYRKRNVDVVGPGISKSLLHVRTALIGAALHQETPFLFDSFQFGVEGLDEWVGASGIEVNRSSNNHDFAILFRVPDTVTLSLGDKFKLSIVYSWSANRSCINEAAVKYKAYFRLTSDEARPLHDYIAIAHKVTNLIGFAVDETVAMEDVSVTSELVTQKIDGHSEVPAPIRVFYQSLPFMDELPKVQAHKMLFRFSHLLNSPEKAFNHWVEAYGVIEPTLNLYFSVRAGAHRYLDTKFLALAHGLETYHRRTSGEKRMPDEEYQTLVKAITRGCPSEHKKWLEGRLFHGNELSLRNRLMNIVEPFKELLGNSGARRTLINGIVDTRNYLTHYDPALKENAARGREMWELCLKMEAVCQLHLLQIIGFSKEQVQEVVKNSQALQWKLNAGQSKE